MGTAPRLLYWHFLFARSVYEQKDWQWLYKHWADEFAPGYIEQHNLRAKNNESNK